MKYLIKDLAELTNFSKDRIRKWQARYKLLKPTLGENGYYYHSNEDFYVLNAVKKKLESGQKFKDIIRLGRENLLNERFDKFNEEELRIIDLIDKNHFFSLGKVYDQKSKKNFVNWIREDLHPLVVLVGKAWEEKLITVAAEHAFSRWFFGYFSQKIQAFITDSTPEILVSVYPKDNHELGALLHYGELLHSKKSVRFCGKLAEDQLFKELQSQRYKELHVSAVRRYKNSEIENFKRRILQRFSKVSIKIGGRGTQE